ncbi:hypothetical protein OQA88_2770 [Cercophora sp. LCS_1]
MTVPNDYTLPDTDPASWCREGIYDHFKFGQGRQAGHGTMLASLAAGTTHGIASKAKLYLIKASNCWTERDATSGHTFYKDAAYFPDAIRVAYEKIEEIVLARNLQGKAVVNFAFSGFERGWRRRPDGMTDDKEWETWTQDAATAEDTWARFRQFCQQNGVIVVTSSGNADYSRGREWRLLGDRVPHRYSGPDSELIVVGSSSYYGQMLVDNAQPGYTDERGWVVQDPRRASPYQLLGHIDVFAMGLKVDVVTVGGLQTRSSGTSVAAPQVAGLIAYFLSLPQTRNDWVWDPVRNAQELWGLRMKRLIRSYSWHYAPGHSANWVYPPNPPYALPTIVNVANNGAFGNNNAACSQNGIGRRVSNNLNGVNNLYGLHNGHHVKQFRVVDEPHGSHNNCSIEYYYSINDIYDIHGDHGIKFYRADFFHHVDCFSYNHSFDQVHDVDRFHRNDYPLNYDERYVHCIQGPHQVYNIYLTYEFYDIDYFYNDDIRRFHQVDNVCFLDQIYNVYNVNNIHRNTVEDIFHYLHGRPNNDGCW